VRRIRELKTSKRGILHERFQFTHADGADAAPLQTLDGKSIGVDGACVRRPGRKTPEKNDLQKTAS